jgi:hypothetical protein
LKLSQDSQACARPWGIERIHLERRDEILVDVAGVVGWGSNGGFHALNLAVQFGAKRIALVGYDMRIDQGLHWHGAHERLNNPSAHSCELWRRAIDGVAAKIADLGIEVLNASPISALRNYKKVTLGEALGC